MKHWLGLLLPLCGCHDSPRAVMRLENRSGEVEEFALEVVEPDIDTGLALLEARELRALGAGAVYKGMSGAPIYVDGQLVGGLSDTVGWGETRAFSYTSLERIQAFASLAHALAPDPGPRLPATRGLEPGAMIAAFSVWGDLCLGPIGTVTEIDGVDLSCFSHGFEILGGTRSRALFAVRPVAVRATSDGEHAVLVEKGAAVGRTFFDGPTGTHGRVGALPLHLRVRIALVRGGHVARDWDFRVACNPSYTEEASALAEVLAPWLLEDVRVGSSVRSLDHAWSDVLDGLPECDQRIDEETFDLESWLEEQLSGAPPGAEVRLCVSR